MRARWVGLGLAAVNALSCRSNGTPAREPQASALPRPAPAPRFGAADVDRRLRDEWHAQGITPAARVDDARFLRRVYLDVIGRIPSVDEIQHYDADASEGRRANVVEALLASPGYADHWTNYWEDVLLLDKVDAKFVDRDEFRGFLHAQFEHDAPWSQIVHALIGAQGLNRASAETQGTANGAVSWLLQYRESPQDLAGKVASTFLGVKIQCAQCHDHKTEKWKQLDFQQFASCFTHMKAIPVQWESD